MNSRFAFNRQNVSIAALFVILMGAVLLRGRTEIPTQSYDPESRRPNGLYLLHRWVDDMGYRFTTTANRRFTLADDLGLLLVYPSEEAFRTEEAAEVLAWVEAGATLAVIGNPDEALAEAFGYTWQDLDFSNFVTTATQPQPLLPAAPAEIVGTGAATLPQPESDSALPVLTDGIDQPLVWAVPQGEGWLWLLPRRYAFTNADLMDNREMAPLLLAMLRFVPDGAAVAVDTYHLFGPEVAVMTIQDWLYSTPLGWATLFLLLLMALYFVLSGRRLGPALAVITQGRRREASEFVVAMAGLQQRARVRDSIARHHRQRLLLALGRPHGIPPDLPDAEFLARLRESDRGISAERIAHIERSLRAFAALPDAQTLVTLVAEVDEILQRKPHHTL